MNYGSLNIIQWLAGGTLGWAIKFGQDKYTAIRRPGRLMRKMMNVLPITNAKTQKTIYVRPSIDVVAAGAGIKSKRGYTHSSEAIGLQHLANAVHGLPITLVFDYGTQITDIDSCRIVFGLSRTKSKISDYLFERIASTTKIKLIKGQTSHQYFCDGSGREYRCAHVEDPEFSTRVTKDYGIIYRCVGHNGGALLLCGGIHMFGTQAAIQVALSDAFIERVRKSKCDEFIQIVEVSIHQDGIMIDMDSIRWRDLPFVAVGPKRSFWRLRET